jgi:hypothetical protein
VAVDIWYLIDSVTRAGLSEVGRTMTHSQLVQLARIFIAKTDAI